MSEKTKKQSKKQSLVKGQPPVLQLNLKRQWFDMIGDPKMEEYREIKPHWDLFFATGNIRIGGIAYKPSDVIVCFSNGFATNRPQKKFKIKGLRIGTGKEEWGAVTGVDYYVIEIGEIVSL